MDQTRASSANIAGPRGALASGSLRDRLDGRRRAPFVEPTDDGCETSRLATPRRRRTVAAGGGPPDERPSERGLSLTEALISLTLMAMLAVAGVPALDELHRAAALGTASRRLAGILGRCRAFAVLHRTSTAVVFESRGDGSWRCFVAEDGDHDGVRHDDLAAGRDHEVGDVVLLEDPAAGIGILNGVKVPDPAGGRALRGTDPVRAGRGDMISFAPTGGASPASVYLTDRASRMRVVRVYGGTGRVRTLRWELGWPRWRAGW